MYWPQVVAGIVGIILGSMIIPFVIIMGERKRKGKRKAK